MGIFKETAIIAAHVALGAGINKVLEGVEVTVPGSMETVTKILESLPVVVPAIIWGGLKIRQGVKFISGEDPLPGVKKNRTDGENWYFYDADKKRKENGN
jgi:hypothetical protein